MRDQFPPITDPDLLECGKRIAGEINLHLLVTDWSEIKNNWMAFSLQDGRSDGVLYDSHPDAADHQKDERRALYVCFSGIGPNGAVQMECAKLLHFWREAYKAGGRFIDKGERYQMPLYTAAQNDYRNALLREDFIDKSIREFMKLNRGIIIP